MKQSIIVAAVVVLCVFSYAADKRESGKSHGVSIKEMKYDPAQIEIAVGDTVVWTNKDDRDHTVTSKDGGFKSGNIGKGETFEHKFTKAGKYTYSCAHHPRMKGVVVVGGG